MDTIKKDWFRIKGYPHIGLPLEAIDKKWVEKYVKDKKKIEIHAFSPFIHKKIIVRKFRREICHDGTRSKLRIPTEKKREIYYANHLDSNIFSFYAEQLQMEYEKRLIERDITECVTAYRKIKLDEHRNKCNIDFANDIFLYIKNNSFSKLVAITFDIKSFFDNLDHKILKKYWRSVIMSGSNLPEDHYNVFRNITKFSFIEEKNIFNEFKNTILVRRQPDSNNPNEIRPKHVKKKKYLKNKKAVAYCNKNDIEILRKKNYIKANKFEWDNNNKIEAKLRKKGIPQGSPISSVLANIYLLDFDTNANAFLKAKAGIYKRYSDDMVVVCNAENEDEIIEHFYNEIKKFKLEIQPSKTQIFHFIKDCNKNRYFCYEKNLNTKKLKDNTNFEYLGFQFDGHFAMLKSSSLAGYYRKMKRTIKRGFFYSNANKTKTKGILFKTRLYKRFTYLGAKRRMIYERDKHDKSKFNISHKYDWGNYLSYAKLAARIIPNNKIKSQISGHWKKFHSLILSSK